jgi:hypothetical protein
VDQALADVHDRAGATLVADLLAMGEQQVVKDRIVAQAEARLAHVDQVEGAELHVEAERPRSGVVGRGLGGGTGDGDTAEQDEQHANAALVRVVPRMGVGARKSVVASELRVRRGRR